MERWAGWFLGTDISRWSHAIVMRCSKISSGRQLRRADAEPFARASLDRSRACASCVATVVVSAPADHRWERALLPVICEFHLH